MIQNLADALGAHLATTRPLIEAGWSDLKNQIGLSGRTVKPKLIITFGVSGSVQFRAGMENSELIIAVNSNPNANLMKIAHIAIVGDLYKIIPSLYEKIKNRLPCLYDDIFEDEHDQLKIFENFVFLLHLLQLGKIKYQKETNFLYL